MNRERSNILGQCLGLLGLTDTQTAREHLAVLAECMEIREQRGLKYGENWRTYGWMDSFMHMRSKLSRMTQVFWKKDAKHEESDLDNPLDLINYAVFFIRNYREGNERGADG